MRTLIQPVMKDSALRAEVIEVLRSGSPNLSVWWLGQSGFLAVAAGRSVLFDPYLSDSLTRKYANTDKPHVRLSERVVAPELLDFVEVVTSSHMHTDHMDAETLVPLMKASRGVRLVIPEANREAVVTRLGVSAEWPVGLDAGGEVDLGGIRVLGIPAAHNDLARDGAGRHLYMGFVVRWGGFTLYHSGDTLHFEGMEGWVGRFRPDLVMLPINGNKPERRVAGNLDGLEAAKLAKAVGARWVVPCHYDLFEFNTASPEPFAEECRRLGQPHVVLKLGGRLDVEKGGG